MVTAEDIAREIGNDGELKRKSKVTAFIDLPGVPEGTTGKVALVNGWDTWVRYHVLFDNGVNIGSLNRPTLAPAKKYASFAQLRTEALESGVFDRAAETDAGAGDGDGAAAGAAGGDVVVGGVTIPGHLVERSQAARSRLGG